MALNIFNFINFAGIKEDFLSKNFSVYGQWNGLLCVILCLALGIANIFHFNAVVVFAIIAIIQGLILIFVEIPFLLRICPMSENFNTFIKRFNQNWPRAAFYAVPAIFLLFSSIFYALAAIKHQKFQNSAGGALNTSVDTFPTDAAIREIL